MCVMMPSLLKPSLISRASNPPDLRAVSVEPALPGHLLLVLHFRRVSEQKKGAQRGEKPFLKRNLCSE